MATSIINFILFIIENFDVEEEEGAYSLDFYGWRGIYGDGIFDLYRRCDNLHLSRKNAKRLAKLVSHYLTAGAAAWDEATQVRVSHTTSGKYGEWTTNLRVGGITTTHVVERKGMCGAITNGYPRCATVGIRHCA